MHLSKEQCENWRKTVDYALPGLLNLVSNIPGKALIIGASILQIYKEAGWIKKARSTGDLDLSVGLVSSTSEYESIRQELFKLGYKASDPDRHYRLFSPVQVSLEISYVDLLAHPQGMISKAETRNVMGVGNAWSFDVILFAAEEAYQISKNIDIPNPIGFLALKCASYIDDPQRTRDIVDILDVVFGLVENGFHYDLKETWQLMKRINKDQANLVMNMIQGIADEQIEWDLRRAEQEYLQRDYTDEMIEIETQRIFSEFADAVFST